jgi:hypothetical protein
MYAHELGHAVAGLQKLYGRQVGRKESGHGSAGNFGVGGHSLRTLIRRETLENPTYHNQFS